MCAGIRKWEGRERRGGRGKTGTKEVRQTEIDDHTHKPERRARQRVRKSEKE